MVLQSHFWLHWGHSIKNVLKKSEVKSLLKGRSDTRGTCKWGATFEGRARLEINMEFHCNTAIKGNRGWIGMSKGKRVVGTALVRSTMALRNPKKSFQWQPPSAGWISPFQKKPLEVFNSRRWARPQEGDANGAIEKAMERQIKSGRDGNQGIPNGKRLLEMGMGGGHCSVAPLDLGELL